MSALFAALFERWDYPLEVNKGGENGTKKDLPLCEVLKYFQAPEFRDPERSNLHKFGIIGFDRFGRAPVAILKPYARRHVYKVRAAPPAVSGCMLIGCCAHS